MAAAKQQEIHDVILSYVYRNSETHGKKQVVYRNQTNSDKAVDHSTDVIARALDTDTDVRLDITLDDGEWIMTAIVNKGTYTALFANPDKGIVVREGR